jgi:hypothetical protein
MRPLWPDDTVFQRLVLDVESDSCEHCGRVLHICDHRFHRFHTLHGPMELVCRLAHCSDRACPARCHTLSPVAEMSVALPRCLVGWDVFCWMGHRRFRQHWSVPQLEDELQQTYHITLCKDTVVNYLRRYQNMLAARQQDAVQMAKAYRGINSLVLTIDGLQPEKGHETLYVVREINAKRIWFGEALLSSSTDEIRRLFVRAHEIADQLKLPVKLWLSDKQEAFVKGVEAAFPAASHRYCQNHFVRNLAKPTLEQDSSAKVQMRKKVRGLREIEREVLDDRRERQASERAQSPSPDEPRHETASAPVPAMVPAPSGGEADIKFAPGALSAEDAGQETAATPLTCVAAEQMPAGKDTLEQVVLDYCAVVRGILNDDQGGPLHPPGMRMAEALSEVRESLERNLELNKPGPAHGQLERLAGLIESGLASVKQEQEEVRQQVKEISKVAATLEEKTGTRKERRARYEKLQRGYEAKDDAFHSHLARMMRDWKEGLFLGPRAKKGEKGLQDNLELERWFRKPKRHERKIHGRRHAGMRIVQEGPTLVHVLDAHDAHPGPFTAEELAPYWSAEAPAEQQEALQRRKVMRRARSKKNEKSSSES